MFLALVFTLLPPLISPTLTPSSSQAIPDLGARVRNVRLLVEDLPWAHQPLLLAIADLFASISHPAPPPPQQPPQPTLALPPPPLASNPAERVTTATATAAAAAAVVTVGETERLGLLGGAATGVSIRDAAEALAPALLPPPPPPPPVVVGQAGSGSRGGSGGGSGAGGIVFPGEVLERPGWEEELAAVAVVEVILSEQVRVLEGMRAERRRR